MRQLSIVDLVLHAASLCQYCRSGQRPKYEYSQEQGAEVSHP
jgi:hypothetical protein